MSLLKYFLRFLQFLFNIGTPQLVQKIILKMLVKFFFLYNRLSFLFAAKL